MRLALRAVQCGERGRVHSVEDEEAGADEKKERELDEDDDAAGEQGEARLAQVARGEHSLNHQLVGAVRGHGEECSAEDSGPEGVGRRQVDGEVEHVELARGGGNGVDRAPSRRGCACPSDQMATSVPAM